MATLSAILGSLNLAESDFFIKLSESYERKSFRSKGERMLYEKFLEIDLVSFSILIIFYLNYYKWKINKTKNYFHVIFNNTYIFV